MAKTLLLYEIKCQKQMWPCFCRGSTLTNLNDCDFASAGSQKNKEWPRPCFCRRSSAKTNATLLLQGVNISTNLNDFDFASAGSRKINNGQDLASAGDQVPKTNVTLLLQGVNINKFKWLWLCLCRESKNKEWSRPCFGRGSSIKNKCDLASTGGQH